MIKSITIIENMAVIKSPFSTKYSPSLLFITHPKLVTDLDKFYLGIHLQIKSLINFNNLSNIF
jgi:hypothetical protein